MSGVVCPGSWDQSCINTGDNAWMLASTALVILMTPGLALFYGGLVRQRNVLNALQMSLIAMGIICVQWVFVGYTFSFGWHSKGFGDGTWVGFRDVGQEPNPDYAPTVSHQIFAIYQMAFAIVTPAIISGALVERIGFLPWMIYVTVWTTVVYDPLAHWVWSAKTVDGVLELGFLRDLGALDFAGGTVVHISSGYAALVAAFVCGPRRKVNLRHPPEGHNIPMFVLGAALLWFGWFGFNGGSALSAGGLAALAFTNTQIATGTAMLVWAVLDIITKRGAVTVTGPLSGAVVGLVAITPAAGFVHPPSSIAIGTIASAVIFLLVWLKTWLLNGRWIMKYYDDALDVFLAHGMGGTLGALLTGFFSSKDVNPAGADGVFFGQGDLLGWQVVAIMVAISLTTLGTLVILFILKFTIGLRYSSDDELEGVDFVAHKQVAYRISDIEKGVEHKIKDSDFHGLRGSRILTKPMMKVLEKAWAKARNGEEQEMSDLDKVDGEHKDLDSDKEEETQEAFTGRFGSVIMRVKKDHQSSDNLRSPKSPKTPKKKEESSEDSSSSESG